MRNTVKKAYLKIGSSMQRTIVDAQGRVYDPSTRSWAHPDGEVIPTGRAYERWCDVPELWVGHQPFWC